MSRWIPDLHTHTNASDGAFKPSELLLRAADRGLNLISITDHDTLDGIREAQKTANELNIRLIPGIELSAEGSKELHILGYFIETGHKAFDDMLKALRLDRISREEKYLKKLKGLGFHISHSDLAIAGDTLFSRPLLARAMVNKGYVNSVKEAFDLYLASGKAAYVQKLCITAEEVIGNIRLAKAVPVIAHPGLLKLSDIEFEITIKKWKSAGLMGIEVYHPSHTTEQCIKFSQIARKYDLIVTGGSDFHRQDDSFHGDLGQMLSQWMDASSDVSRLLALVE